MLDDTCAEGMEDIVSWQPGGKSFRVHKPKEFAANVMPRYFKKIKYRSWQRQLHIYGFRLIKNKKSLDHGAYCHPQFIRGQKDLCLQMTRARMNKGGNSSEGLLKDKLKSKLASLTQKETSNVVSPSHSIEESPASPEPLNLSNQPSFVPQNKSPAAAEWVSFAQQLLTDNQEKVTNNDTWRDGDEMFFEGMRFYFVEEPQDKLECSRNTSLHVPTIPQPQPRGMQQHVLANPAA